jgi:16S rRNA (uracil1498-N3)-methyltransferase
MQPGQPLVLFNGDGNNYPSELDEVGKKQVTARVLQAQPSLSEPRLKVVLGQVISKGDRMDYAVQKSTELGVDTIVPLTSERCDVRLKGDREDKRIRHWQQVAISAAEQCGRATVPTITPLSTLTDWFEQSRCCDLRLVLHHRSEQALDQLAAPANGIALLIGPEGGLSEAEITMALAQDFHPAALGPRVLRTETAPVAAITLCQWLWGDLRD